MNDLPLYYSVGPLLYCPANRDTFVSSIINNNFGTHFSLALCLEDTIRDDCVAEAENIMLQSLNTLFQASATQDFYLPKIFVRIRDFRQITNLYNRLGSAKGLLTGFILPKFSMENVDDYLNAIREVNQNADSPVYIMPILESPSMIHLQNRYELLYNLKEKLDDISDLVLNIRVGGNDLCHMFGFRRHSDESIHQIRPIANIFSDIITVFGMEYVVSGPVWEYYNGENWEKGFLNELKEDRLCGFIGKTVIHPKQIELVNQAYKVSLQDYEDAKAVLNWDESSHSLVAGGAGKERMNEYKTHSNWARRILMLASAYGIAE